MTRRIERIRDQLTQAFSPRQLDVVDDSARHAGHAGAAPEGETHFNITIASPAFDGLSRVQVHRLINAALADEFAAGLHALSIKVTS